MIKKIIRFIGMLLWKFKSKKAKDEMINDFNEEVIEEAKKISGLRRAMKNSGKRYASTKGFQIPCGQGKVIVNKNNY